MDIEKELEQTIDALPLEPPKDTISKLIAQGKLKGNALIYKAGYDKKILSGEKNLCCDVVCTACGEYFKLDYVSSAAGCCCYGRSEIGFIDPFDNEAKRTGACCFCPVCGAEAKALHTGQIHTTFGISYSDLVTVHNIRGHLAVLMWEAVKCCDKNGNITYRVYRQHGAIVINRKIYRVVSKQTFFRASIYLSGWQLRKRFFDGINSIDSQCFLEIDAKEIERTDSAHCALCEYISAISGEIAPLKYLQAWCCYPQIENLVRRGYSRLVNDMINCCSEGTRYIDGTAQYRLSKEKLKNALNWHKYKPHEILELEKEELSRATKGDYKYVKLYSLCKRKYGVKLSASQLKAACLQFDDFVEMLENGCNGYFPSPIRLLNYLESQKNSKTTSLHFLRDYWNLLNIAVGTMEKSLLYPKDFHVAHEQMLIRAEVKKNSAYNAGIVKCAKRNKRYEFADDETGLFIRPCATQEELIIEGRSLHHCVATYAQAIAEGKTCIFVIRKATAPNVPFFTLEYRNKKVIQNAGNRNCSRTAEVEKFEKKWLEFMNNGGKNYGKRNSNQHTTASA